MNPKLLCLAILCTGLAAAGCDRGPSDETWVASVDDVSITLGGFRRAVEARVQDDPSLRRDDIINEELNRIVSQQLILNRAEKVGIEVLDEDIDRRMRQIHGEDFGEIEADYREEVRLQMALDRTQLLDLADRVRVPESKLVLYYEEHRDEYSLPERVQLRQIVVEEETRALELRQRLIDGADFAALAAEHSLAPEASGGGLLPPFGRGEMPEAFERAFDLSPGELSGVIESPYGFHVFRMEERLKPTTPEYGEVRARIMLELERKRLEDLRRDWLRSLRRDADIQINEPLLETLR